MNKPTLILLISTLALGTAAAYLRGQLQTERERTAQLADRIAQLERTASASIEHETAVTAAPVQDTPPEMPRTVATTAPRIDPVTANGLSLATADKPGRDRMRQVRARMMQRERELMNDPEYREAMRTQQRMGLTQMHPDLAAELGVSPQEANRLLDLLAEQQLRSMQDSRWFDPETRSDPNAMSEFQRKMEERQRTDRAEIAQLLGNEVLTRWDDYQNTQSSRFRVRQLSSALEAAGMPLQQEQQRQLRQALADHERQLRTESPFATQRRDAKNTPEDNLRMLEEHLEWQEDAYERARNSVSGILSPEQLDTYRQMHQQELAMQRAQLRLQRAQLDAGEADGETIYFSGNTVAMPAAVVEGD